MSYAKSDQEMATAASQRPLVLLRRPLPPKQLPPPTSVRSRKEDEYSETTDCYKVLSKSPDVSNVKTTTKSKVDETSTEVRFYGDVPVPIKSVVKPFKTKGPDPLPPRPPRKLRELPVEAFIKDSYTRPPPEFTLKEFERRLPSRTRLNDDGDPMISDQNYEKLTSWFAANKPKQSTIHSVEIDSEYTMLFLFLQTNIIMFIIIIYMIKVPGSPASRPHYLKLNQPKDWTSLTSSHLDFTSQVCSPHQAYLNDMIKALQHRATVG